MKTETKKSFQCRVLHLKVNHLLGLLILLTIIGLSRTASAQFKQGIILHAGASCQSDVLHLYDNGELKFAYGAGWMAEYGLSQGFAIQSGLEYFEKGNRPEIGGITVDNKFHYLELPVLAKVKLGQKVGLKNGRRFYVNGGPYLSYLLAAKSHENNVTTDFSDSMNKLDAGLRLGFGFEFPMSENNRLQIGLNYDMGLAEVYKSEDGMNNKMATVNVGLLF